MDETGIRPTLMYLTGLKDDDELEAAAFGDQRWLITSDKSAAGRAAVRRQTSGRRRGHPSRWRRMDQ